MNKSIRIHLLIALLLVTASAASQTQIIAHRGYWKTDGSAQNSITALMKADSIGVYGSEVDIWLSADGIPVVNHDADIAVDGKKLIIEQTPYSTLKQARLANGEPMPTVEEYLNAFEKCRNIQLIVEFKMHKSAENENILAKKVIDMVRERGLEERVEYISFGVNFMNQVRRLAPQAKAYYLNGDMPPSVLSAMGLAGFDYNINVLYKNPQWVKQAHDLGMKVNVWTVNKVEDIQKMKELQVDFITTDEPLLVRKIVE